MEEKHGITQPQLGIKPIIPRRPGPYLRVGCDLIENTEYKGDYRDIDAIYTITNYKIANNIQNKPINT